MHVPADFTELVRTRRISSYDKSLSTFKLSLLYITGSDYTIIDSITNTETTISLPVAWHFIHWCRYLLYSNFCTPLFYFIHGSFDLIQIESATGSGDWLLLIIRNNLPAACYTRRVTRYRVITAGVRRKYGYLLIIPLQEKSDVSCVVLLVAAAH